MTRYPTTATMRTIRLPRAAAPVRAAGGSTPAAAAASASSSCAAASSASAGPRTSISDDGNCNGGNRGRGGSFVRGSVTLQLTSATQTHTLSPLSDDSQQNAFQ